MSPVPFGNEMESPRKPVYNENLGQKIMRNGVEIPTLDTGDDLDRFGSPSPRAPIRTDKEVSPLQLAKKDKSKERQDKLQAEKDEAANEGNLNVTSPKDAEHTSNAQVRIYIFIEYVGNQIYIILKYSFKFHINILNANFRRIQATTTQPLNMTLPLPMKKTENQLDKQTMKNLKENFQTTKQGRSL